jgi:hypothetical protein
MPAKVVEKNTEVLPTELEADTELTDSTIFE